MSGRDGSGPVGATPAELRQQGVGAVVGAGVSGGERPAGKGRILGSWERIDLVHQLSLKAAEKSLLIALAKHEARRDGVAWASLKTLSAETGFKLRSLGYALAKLRSLDLVFVYSSPRQRLRANILWNAVVARTRADFPQKSDPAAPDAAAPLAAEGESGAPPASGCRNNDSQIEDLLQKDSQSTAWDAHKGSEGLTLDKGESSRVDEGISDDLVSSLLNAARTVYSAATTALVLWSAQRILERAKTEPRDQEAYLSTAIVNFFKNFEGEIASWLTGEAEKQLRSTPPPRMGDLVEALKFLASGREIPYDGAAIEAAVSEAERRIERERQLQSEQTVGGPRGEG